MVYEKELRFRYFLILYFIIFDIFIIYWTSVTRLLETVMYNIINVIILSFCVKFSFVNLHKKYKFIIQVLMKITINERRFKNLNDFKTAIMIQ